MADQPEVKAPQPAKSAERRFAEAVTSMIGTMARIYRNQAVGGLQAKTVKKLPGADAAQVGNYAAVFTRLSRATIRKLRKRYDDKRIKALIRRLYEQSDARARRELYARVAEQLGIPVARLLASDATVATSNALIEQSRVWVTKLRDEALESFQANSLRVMSMGGDISDVLEDLSKIEETFRGRARMNARTQISSYNSLMTKARAQNLGAERAVWETADDERVRTSHMARDGKEFELSEGLYSSEDGKTLLPGVDYNCRCTYRLKLPKPGGRVDS